MTFESVLLGTIAVIALILSFAMIGYFWLLYYLQYIQPYGWKDGLFKSVPGKMSHIAAVAVVSVFWWTGVFLAFQQLL